MLILLAFYEQNTKKGVSLEQKLFKIFYISTFLYHKKIMPWWTYVTQ